MRRVLFAFAVLASAAWAPLVAAAETAAPVDVAKMTERGVAYLEQHQAADGSFAKEEGPGVTSLVATALVTSGRTADDPVVAKALKFIADHLKPDGGIYSDGSLHQNYETCVALVALKAANADGRFDKLLAGAEKYVRDQQWDEGEGHSEKDLVYGGAGYGGHSRPDLSNTGFLLDALKTLGHGPEDPAIQRALIFVSRCQNLEGEHNQLEKAAIVNDGGFFYTAASGGLSAAGELPNGGLRSYGSMTYAGLKSMIYAGLDKNDPRVKAALGWIAKNYSLEQNPGMGTAGIFYYYHMFAKALAAMGEPSIADADGKDHDWRGELIAELARRQRRDGSWINDNERWMENDANLVTAYAILTLSYCK